MQVEIRAAVDQFRRGDTETAFFELIEMTDDVLPAIVDIFRGEPQPDVRAFLVKAAWERREDAVIPFLAEALNDDAEEVWQKPSMAWWPFRRKSHWNSYNLHVLASSKTPLPNGFTFGLKRRFNRFSSSSEPKLNLIPARLRKSYGRS
ncbi:MAG: hypothetical protein E6J73_13610 [Deltaproteobacteria bacterium]|nr:MAG: hypothetical protein E6J73_13610 [Deltaproteobacteria bacterium]